MNKEYTGEVLEVVFGNSIYHTIKKSTLSNNVLMLNVLFNI